MRVAAMLRGSLRPIIDIGLPPLCPACREPVRDAGALCPQCWSRLNFITRPYCERLGIPFAFDPGPGILSMQAIADPPAYGRARAAVRFDDVARALVHAVKYGDRLDLVPTLGRWMASAGHELLADADALVPVPLHWRRLWARRFNQSAILAQEVARLTGLRYAPAVLVRARRTAPQVGLSRQQRRDNVAGAFAVAPDQGGALAGANIVLIDDVITTGATARACTRPLKRAGAARVDVLALAMVTDPAFLSP